MVPAWKFQTFALLFLISAAEAVDCPAQISGPVTDNLANTIQGGTLAQTAELGNAVVVCPGGSQQHNPGSNSLVSTLTL